MCVCMDTCMNTCVYGCVYQMSDGIPKKRMITKKV